MTTARGSWRSTHHRTALTEPSRALTGRPSAPLIESGSPKKARYSRAGASQQSSGPGIRAVCRAMRTINGLDDLRAAEGETLGTSDWHEISQDDINTFADVTGDHQWIHVDTERAKDTPFGGTIAHGYYTLSLIPMLSAQVLDFEGFAFGLNYGLDKVRFPSAMPVGGKVRATLRPAEVRAAAGGRQVTRAATPEGEGGEKPVCVAESLARF